MIKYLSITYEPLTLNSKSYLYKIYYHQAYSKLYQAISIRLSYYFWSNILKQINLFLEHLHKQVSFKNLKLFLITY